MSIITCDRTSLERVTPADIESLARWITDSGEAPLISSLKSTLVQPAEVEAWLGNGLEGWILRIQDEPMALGTLSTQEAELPDNAVEVCHVIVHPEWRRRYKGTQLVVELMGCARNLGFKRVVGRVVPGNTTSHGFLQWLDWKPAPLISPPDAKEFVWYKRDLAL